MQASTLFGMVGILVTILFGVCAVYLGLKRRYPGQVTFIRQHEIPLFDSIVKNLPDLSVQYQGAPVSQGLVLLKGCLLNTGSKDITESMVEEKLALNLPDGFRWLTAKIVDTSPKVQSEMNVQPRTLTVTTGLFRRKEYIRLEALAEVPVPEEESENKKADVGQRLEDALQITHRIADTQPVQAQELIDATRQHRLFRRVLYPSAIGIGLVLAVLILNCFIGWPARVNYYFYADGTQDPIEVRIYPKLDGTITIKGVHSQFKKETTFDEFFKDAKPKPKLVPDPKEKYLIAATLVMYILVPVAIWAWFYSRHRKAKKLRGLLDLPE